MLEGESRPHEKAPRYLDEAEALIGLPFFGDKKEAVFARTTPSAIEPVRFESRMDLYVTAMRIAVQACHALYPDRPPRGPQVWERVAEANRAIHHRFANEICSLRGELMLLDPALKPEYVVEFEEVVTRALASHRHIDSEPTPKPRDRGLSSVGVLPPYLIPVSVLDKAIDSSSGNAWQALQYRGAITRKMKLPGQAPAENLVMWADVAGLEATHGARPGAVQIDYERLPTGPADDDPEKIAYAREIQQHLVPHHKLSNIPELEGRIHPWSAGTARPYHISRNTLKEIFGGGYHFIDNYCTERGFSLAYLNRPDKFGRGEYLILEQAAEIWRDYSAIPPATEDDITLIEVIRRSDTVFRKMSEYTMSADERAQIEVKRALKPKGRVLEHVPAKLGLELMLRLRAVPLPPSLLPAGALAKRFDVGYTAIMHHLEGTVIEATKLRPLGSAKRQSCYDWPTIRYLEEVYGPPLDEIDYSRLPRHQDDLDFERVAYAQTVQRRYLSPAIAKGSSQFGRPDTVLHELQNLRKPRRGAEQLPRGAKLDCRGIAELTGYDYETILQFLSQHYPSNDPAEKIDYAQLQLEGARLREVIEQLVGVHVTVLARESGFAPEAVKRLLQQRGHHSLDDYFPRASHEVLNGLHAPPGWTALATTIRDQGLAISPPGAIAFLRRYGGKFGAYLDDEGNPYTYLSPLAAEMLVRQKFPAGRDRPEEKIPPADESWLHRGQILPATTQSAEEFEAWTALNIDPVLDVEWRTTKAGVALPHFWRESVAPFLEEFARGEDRKGGIKPKAK